MKHKKKFVKLNFNPSQDYSVNALSLLFVVTVDLSHVKPSEWCLYTVLYTLLKNGCTKIKRII
ncbi:MAG: hypothetical protein LBH75_03035 [Treponema sp.]|nr:hypothetical protein [Treponema sp.]